MVKKNRWGFRLMLFTLLMCAAVYYIHSKFPIVFKSDRFLYSLGAIGALLVILCGHLSYARVHNCKVYLLGYLQGFVLFSFFAPLLASHLFHITPPHGYYGALLILYCINLLIILPVKSLVKYNLVRSITLCIFAIELILVNVAYLSPHATSWVGCINFQSTADLQMWIGPLFALVVTVICITLLKNEFHIGGLISSQALVGGLVWMYGLDNGIPSQIQTILMLVEMVVLLAGIMFHWFSKLEHRVVIDPLLQIYNREYCSKIITEQAPMNLAPPMALAMVDIDHFKHVNDTYGHQAGDDVLYSVAQAVNSAAVANGGIACRYGGEELAVFFPGRGVKDTVKIMDVMRTDIEKIVTESGKKKISVTISCGVAERTESAQSITLVMHAADKALYKAKKGGRNQVKSGKVAG